ncbi:MAG: ParB/RepB/Spo0J family partition protein [Chitinispirillaceae bacterium]|nr:ParB/RepB/Spo0J family partition protein [Chitinispirillaceae bacterium]
MDKKISRKALGRGLSNLIPVNLEDSSKENEIYEVDITSIEPNPFQPRRDFNEEEIKNLAESIKTQGLLQPIVVRPKGEKFEIISGERRFRAFQLLNKDTVPCILRKSVTDREMLELALIENIQREELNEIEKALAYQKLILEYNYTHEQLAEHIGKSRTAITNTLRLLNLPEEVQQMIRRNELSMGHARALLSIKEGDIVAIAKKIATDNISVREVEKLATSTKEDKKKKKVDKEEKKSIDPNLKEVIEQLQYKYGTSVVIKNSDTKNGTLSFLFYGEEDLKRLVDLLLVK